MAKYKLFKYCGEITCIQNTELNSAIPFDSANTDYQEYLEWVAEGNTADAAD